MGVAVHEARNPDLEIPLTTSTPTSKIVGYYISLFIYIYIFIEFSWAEHQGSFAQLDI